MESIPFVSVRELALLSDSNHYHILMLRAYFDESGHSDDPQCNHVVVAGCMSTLEAWTSLEPDWKTCLDTFGISEFHAVHFKHSKGEFKNWLGNLEIQKNFIDRLLQIMKKSVRGVVGSDYVMRTEKKLRNGKSYSEDNPYHQCYRAALHHLLKISSAIGSENHIEVVMADQPEYSTVALDEFRQLKRNLAYSSFRTICFASPNDVIPLQAADLVAYYVNRYFAHNEDEIFLELTASFSNFSIARGGDDWSGEGEF